MNGNGNGNSISFSPMSPRTSQPSVSLIVLAYNHARYLPQLFSSIKANVKDIRELIFIDNGSSDNSAQLMQDFLTESEGKVLTQIFLNRPHTGVAYALNVALHAATSEHIAVTSGDDYLLGNRFSQQLDAMRADPTIQFCYSNGYVCDDDGLLTNVPAHSKRTQALLLSPAEGIADKLYYPVPTLFTQCALFKHSALLEVGGWDEDLVIEDWPLNLKLFTKFWAGFRYIDAFVSVYRRHHGNASKRRFRQYMGQKKVLFKYAKGNNLNRGMFALLASQGGASLKRRQWLRAKVFYRAALSYKPGLPFITKWLIDAVQRHLRSNKIR